MSAHRVFFWFAIAMFTVAAVAGLAGDHSLETRATLTAILDMLIAIYLRSAATPNGTET